MRVVLKVSLESTPTCNEMNKIQLLTVV